MRTELGLGITTLLWCAASSSCFKLSLCCQDICLVSSCGIFLPHSHSSHCSHSPSFSFISSAKFPFITQFAPPPEILTHFICCLLGKKIKGLHLCQFKLPLNKGNQRILQQLFTSLWHYGQVCALSLKQAAKIHFLFLRGGVKSIPNAKSPFPAEDRATFTTGTAQEKVEFQFQCTTQIKEPRWTVPHWDHQVCYDKYVTQSSSDPGGFQDAGRSLLSEHSILHCTQRGTEHSIIWVLPFAK